LARVCRSSPCGLRRRGCEKCIAHFVHAAERAGAGGSGQKRVARNRFYREAVSEAPEHWDDHIARRDSADGSCCVHAPQRVLLLLTCRLVVSLPAAKPHTHVTEQNELERRVPVMSSLICHGRDETPVEEREPPRPEAQLRKVHDALHHGGLPHARQGVVSRAARTHIALPSAWRPLHPPRSPRACDAWAYLCPGKVGADLLRPAVEHREARRARPEEKRLLLHARAPLSSTVRCGYGGVRRARRWGGGARACRRAARKNSRARTSWCTRWRRRQPRKASRRNSSRRAATMYRARFSNRSNCARRARKTRSLSERPHYVHRLRRLAFRG
jgi:hypothetical protein